MLRLSREIDYAIQLTVKLACLSNEKILSLREFSDEKDISFLFLQKIARNLRHAGIIESVRGPQGGYRLAKEPKEILFVDIIEAFGEKNAPVECMRGKECKRSSTCVTRKFSQKLYKDLLETVSKYTLEDIKDT